MSFHTKTDLVVGSTSIPTSRLTLAKQSATETIVISSRIGSLFDIGGDYVVGSTTILQAELKSVTSVTTPTVAGSLRAWKEGEDSISLVIDAKESGMSFHTKTDLVVDSTPVSITSMVTLTHAATKSVTITSADGQVFDTAADLVIGATTISQADLISTTSSLSEESIYEFTSGYKNESHLDRCTSSLSPTAQHQILPPTQKCHACSAGTASLAGKSFCKTCTEGRFAPVITDGSVKGSSLCFSCPKGFKSTVPLFDRCVEIPPTINCTAGKFVDTTTDLCVLCKSGTYQKEDGTSTIERCSLCPAGWFSSTKGSTICVECRTGFFQSSAASFECKQCGTGTKSGQVGSTSCETCASGTYQETTGNTICESCPAGWFSSTKGNTICVQCRAELEYQSEMGADSCKSCPTGWYSGTFARVACKATACPAGTFIRTVEQNGDRRRRFLPGDDDTTKFGDETGVPASNTQQQPSDSSDSDLDSSSSFSSSESKQLPADLLNC